MSFLKRYAFCLTLGLSAALISLTPLGTEFEEAVGLEILFQLRGTQTPPPEVVLVNIGSDSAAALNSLVDPSQWSRFLHAEAIRRLKHAEAELIVFDIYFGDSQPGEDDALSRAMAEAGNVILANQFRLRRLEGLDVETLDRPVAPLVQSALSSAPFLLSQGSESISYLPWQGNSGESHTLPVEVVERYLERTARGGLLTLIHHPNSAYAQPDTQTPPIPWPEVMAELEADPRRLVDSGLSEKVSRALQSLVDVDVNRSARYFDHFGPAGTLTRIPYHSLLLSDQTETLNLKGKIALVGFSEDYPSDDIGEIFASPFSTVSLLELCGTAVADLLENRQPRPLFNASEQALFLMGWGILLGALSLSRSLSAGFWSVLVIGGTYLSVATVLFRMRGLWLPLTLPLFWQTPISLIGCLVANYWKREKETQELIDAIAPNLPPGVWDHIIRRTDPTWARGRMAFGVCLATDAGRYTTLAEKMDPMLLGDLMDKYYGTLFPVVSKYGGRVSDVIGDAMLAIWEGTEKPERLKSLALQTALELLGAVEKFQQNNRVDLPIRIGVHCGDLRIGFVGASDQAQFFRAVGDTVNTAARLESLNKLLGTRIIVSDTLISDMEGFITRPLGRFQLPGKEQPVDVHELIAPGAGSDAATKLVDRFREALSLYQTERLLEATTAFQTILREFSNDGPTQFYLGLLNPSSTPPEPPDSSRQVTRTHKPQAGRPSR